MADQIFNVKCGFFDAVNNDRTYSAEDMNRLYKRVINDGVFPDENNNPSTDLEVNSDSGMTIIVGAGEGIFANRWFKNSINIPIEVPANNLNNRIDSVLVQVDTRKSGRTGNIVYRTGTPATSPEPPAINETTGVTEYRLANILVASGATEITSSNITDLRGTSDCPWVTGIVSADSIPPNSVTSAKLATDAVTTAKIKNANVTSEKIGNGEIKTINLDNGAVTEVKIGQSAVTGDKLSIGAVTSAKLDTGAVTLPKIDNSVYEATPTENSNKLLTSGGAYTALNRKMNFLNLGVNDFALVVTEGKIYQLINDGIQYYAWLIGDIQYRMSVNGLEYREYNDNTHSWGFWTPAIADGSIDIDALADALLITSTSFQVLYDDYHLPTTRFMRDNIINYSMPKLETTIGFLTDGSVAQVIRAQSSTFYGGYGADIKQIYINDTITFIDDDLLTTATSLNRLWVDNVEGAVEFDTELQTKITNGDINVGYRGSFNISNLLVASQKALNARITALENA